MNSKIRDFYIKSITYPSSLGIFINPYFFMKKGIYEGVKKYSNHMKGVMLDFGCDSKPFKGLFDVDKYIGLDIEVSGHNHNDSEVDVFYDGKTIPFPNDYFDSILSAEVIEHVPNLDEMVKELNRVLKPDGKILITVPFLWQEHEIPYDFRRLTSYGVEALLQKSGFTVIKIEKTSNYVESIFQILNAYIYQSFLPKNSIPKYLFMILLIPPFNILGILLGKLLPKDDTLYLSNILVAKKVI